jgi:hypothetical protein
LNRTQRVLWKNGVTLTDVSVAANDWRGAGVTFAYLSGDYLYLGTELPFNRKYFDVSSPNAVTAAVSVDLWTGDSWIAVKDLVDETAVAGKSLAVAGDVSWAQDIDNMRWTSQRISSEVTGLSGTNIYNLYWVRFSWSATLTASTATVSARRPTCRSSILTSPTPT